MTRLITISLVICAFILSSCGGIKESDLTGGSRSSPVKQERQATPQKKESKWRKLATDGYHDPTNPGIKMLQEPGEVLAKLPVDKANIGNLIRWPEALDEGLIQPRTNIYPETKINVIDLNILMKNTGSAAYVLFPHDRHTEWLDCSNCHDKIFPKKAGATQMSMLMILSGEFCGRCHGAVAFPLIACKRCHSVNPKELDQYKIHAVRERIRK